MIALDSSVAIPLVLRNHELHDLVVRWRSRRECALAGHAAVETYSVLTRLPPSSREEPHAIARVLRDQLSPPLVLPAAVSARIIDELADHGIEGGAVYDGLIGLAAREHGCALATLDRRAGGTYRQLGVDVIVPG